MDQNFTDYPEMPQGLRMALMKNLSAFNRFASLSRAEKVSFMQGAHQIGSNEEMEAYVKRLSRS
jgi:hypothetical protein